MKMFEREGKIELKYSSPEKPTKWDVDKIVIDLMEIEQKLNGKVATEIYKEFKVALRFHL